MKINNKLGIYIHIPFCVAKCRYCDFYSKGGCSEGEKADYVKLLDAEIARAAEHFGCGRAVDTIFFGGGTPTSLTAEQLNHILFMVNHYFSVTKDAEISLEANPGTVDAEKFAALKQGGFNRISLGVQSFNNDVLKTLGRIHNSEQAAAAVTAAKQAGFNTNLDLMLGVPQQLLGTFKEDLAKATDLGPDHISFYSLQLEEGTPLYKDYRYGNLQLPAWEENRAMYHYAVDALKAAGYVHYEVSNAAKPGKECCHNLKYWNMDEYLGIGKGAHSFINGMRFENMEFAGVKPQTEKELKGDYIFTALRLIRGLDTQDYENYFGSSFAQDHTKTLPKLIEEGYLQAEGRYIRFTPKGLDTTNIVLSKLLED